MNDPMTELQVGSRVWAVLSLDYERVFRRLLEALGYKDGYKQKAPVLVPLNVVRISKNGWRRYRHAATGIELSVLPHYDSPIATTQLAALRIEIVRLLKRVAYQDGLWWETTDPHPGKCCGETAGRACDRWAFDTLRRLYGRWEEVCAGEWCENT